jgi:hypothetical protein
MNASARALRIVSMFGVFAVLFAPMAGCGREFREEMIGHTPVNGKLMGQPIVSEYAPHWVTGDPQESDDDVYFVGRAVGYMAADEPAAVNAAREDVLQQLAELISTRVCTASGCFDERENAESGFVKRGVNGFTPFDDQRFIRFLPGAELQQFITREACLFTNGIAGELVDRGVYVEKWDTREEPQGLWGRAARGLIRYKCWVRMSIPREKLERRIEDFRKLVADSYERYVKDRERAIAWAEEDRARQIAWAEEDRKARIRREDEDRQWARADQSDDRREARELRKTIMSLHTDVVYRVRGDH